jgi:hypothetical protein
LLVEPRDAGSADQKLSGAELCHNGVQTSGRLLEITPGRYVGAELGDEVVPGR